MLKHCEIVLLNKGINYSKRQSLSVLICACIQRLITQPYSRAYSGFTELRDFDAGRILTRPGVPINRATGPVRDLGTLAQDAF